jgi:hypothetical protein
MALVAGGFVLVPVILGIRTFLGRREAVAISVLVNAGVLLAVWNLLRLTGRLERWHLAGVWLAWVTLLGVAALIQTRRRTAPAETARPPVSGADGASPAEPTFGVSGVVAFVGAIVGSLALHGSAGFGSSLNGDGTETFELARSLRAHPLPYWELETEGRFGTVLVNPSLLNSQLTATLQLLLGDHESSARIAFPLLLGGIAWATARLAGGGWGAAVLAMVMSWIWSQWYTFHVGYDPFHADLANPGVPDAWFTLLLLLAVDSWRTSNFRVAAGCLVAASLVLYAGPVWGVLLGGVGALLEPVSRKRILGGFALGALVTMLIALAYLAVGWLDGSLVGWLRSLQSEYVAEYVAPGDRGIDGLRYLGYLTLISGGLPVLGFARGLARPGWSRTWSGAALAYVAIILGAGVKNLHYLGPLAPLALILWRRGVVIHDDDPGRWWWCRRAMDGTTLLSMLACLTLTEPPLRNVLTDTRELGARTTFDADSYETACRQARLIEPLVARGLVGWEVGPHAWVAYSERVLNSDRPRPFLVSRGPAPSGYRTIGRGADGTALHIRDRAALDWLARPREHGGPIRFPTVLRAAAPTWRGGRE